MMIGKAIGEDRTARECSNYEKLKFAIDALLCNSRGFGGFGCCFAKTVEGEDEWRLKQQEFCQMIKN
jgi:hypothetical protein